MASHTYFDHTPLFQQELVTLQYELPHVARNVLHDARNMRLTSQQEQLSHRFLGRNLLLEYLARLFLFDGDLSGTSGILTKMRRILLAQESTKALMNTARDGAFEIDDWHVMVSLLCTKEDKDGALLYDADAVFRAIYGPLLPMARRDQILL